MFPEPLLSLFAARPRVCRRSARKSALPRSDFLQNAMRLWEDLREMCTIYFHYGKFSGKISGKISTTFFQSHHQWRRAARPLFLEKNQLEIKFIPRVGGWGGVDTPLL